MAEKPSLIDSITEQSDAIFSKMGTSLPRAAQAPPVPENPDPPVPQNTPPPPPKPAEQPPEPPIAEKPPESETEVELDGVKLEMPGEIKSEGGRKSWKFYKESVKKTVTGLNGRIKELEDRVSNVGIQQATELQKKLDQLTVERDELQNALGQTNLERTPEFQAHYVTKESQIIEDAKTVIAPEYAEQLAEVMALPESAMRNQQLEEIIETLPPLQQAELGVALRDIRSIRRDRKEKLNDWKQQLAARDAAYSNRTQMQQTEAAKVFENRLASLSADHPLFKPRENDETYNTTLKGLIDEARQLYLGQGQITPEGRANAALYASAHKLLLNQLLSQQQEIAKLRESNKGMKAAVPTPGAGAAGENRGGVQPLAGGKPESAAERIARVSKEQGWVK